MNSNSYFSSFNTIVLKVKSPVIQPTICELFENAYNELMQFQVFTLQFSQAERKQKLIFFYFISITGPKQDVLNCFSFAECPRDQTYKSCPPLIVITFHSQNSQGGFITGEFNFVLRSSASINSVFWTDHLEKTDILSMFSFDLKIKV